MNTSVSVEIDGKMIKGTIVYQRMAPPNFVEPETFSIILEGRNNPSMFLAKDVKFLETV